MKDNTLFYYLGGNGKGGERKREREGGREREREGERDVFIAF